jgi:predicted phosphodiesterase
MKVISDIHGKFLHLKTILDKDKNSKYIQLGDLGLGFSRLVLGAPEDPKDFGDNFKFIRGNHCSPEDSKNHKNYLGDYGVITDDLPHGMKGFFVSGADSIDKGYRTKGVDWWEEEQLSEKDLMKAIDLYEKEKPDIVFSHDCPKSMYQYIIRGNYINNMTANALDIMFKIHQPKLWCFGHHHRHFEKILKGTRFICLAELEVLDLDGLNL